MLKLPRISFLLTVCVCLNLAFSSVVLSTVPALTNVSVTCHNFTNVLYWNYSESDLQREFHIKICGYEGEPKLVRTSQTYLDVSEYTQDAETGYYIKVEAQPKGSELNVSFEDIHFSYNKDLESDITCVVDFPVLEVSVFPHGVKLSFDHPYYVHKVESLKAEYFYTVVYNETKISDVCYLEDEMCTAEFDLFESLYGSCMNVHVKGFVNRIPIEISKKVCGHVAPDKTDWTMLSTILLCSAVGLLFLIILGSMIYKKLTRPDSQSTIISKLLGIVNSDRIVHVPEQPALSEVMSVGQTPLLETVDQVLFDTSSPMFEEQPHFPTHFPTHVTPEEQDDEEVTEDADSGGFNSGNSFSGYDSHKFPIDMGQGDIVEAYGPR